MTACAFHAHTGDEPCPHCIEKGATDRNTAALAFDQSTKSYRLPGRTSWVDDCPKCANTDLRMNVMARKIWCSQCGAQAPLIDRTIAEIQKMRGMLK